MGRHGYMQFFERSQNVWGALKAGVHMKAVFWLVIMASTQISRLRFKQSSRSLLIPHIYVSTHMDDEGSVTAPENYPRLAGSSWVIFRGGVQNPHHPCV